MSWIIPELNINIIKIMLYILTLQLLIRSLMQFPASEKILQFPCQIYENIFN